MSVEILYFVLGLSGTIILILLGVLGFFLARVVTDVKSNSTEIGRNKGRIELVEQQQINDVKRIEELTQTELKSLGGAVNELTRNVNTLVTALAKRGMDS